MTDGGDGDGNGASDGDRGEADPLAAAAAEPDPADLPDPGAFPADPERAAFLREIAEDVRGDSSESQQLAAILYRTSDLYDPDEETTPTEIYLNVRNIMRIKEQGGLRR